ncbi:MAG: SUKH-3 domain-containing protein [Solobacterium sp.]|nr:SUKH-3 domain-containing protein [Solobacterium sp.]
MDLHWTDGFEICVSVKDNSTVISANREGLLSLADHLRMLAEEPFGSHIHLDEFNALEEGSSSLILEKAGPMKKYEEVRIKDGRWTCILKDMTMQEDGQIPLIRKTAFAPAEWYEYGLAKDGAGYETYRWCENDLYSDSDYTRRVPKKTLIREFEALIPLFTRENREDDAERCRTMIKDLQNRIEKEIIPLSGTLRERISQMIRTAAEPVSQEELFRFYGFSEENRFFLHPQAALFYQNFGHLFYHLRPVFEKESQAKEFCFTFCCDDPDLAEEMKEDIGKIAEPVCPIGRIGYGFPAAVYMAEDGRLLCLHDYEDELLTFPALEDLLEHELCGNVPRGLIRAEELL